MIKEYTQNRSSDTNLKQEIVKDSFIE